MNIPFDRVICNAEETANYLKQSKAHFLRVTRHKEGFPAPVPASTDGHPKW